MCDRELLSMQYKLLLASFIEASSLKQVTIVSSMADGGGQWPLFFLIFIIISIIFFWEKKNKTSP